MRAGAPRALFDLCAGFVYSQILFACVRLRLFDHLADGPRQRDASFARALSLPVDSTDPAARRRGVAASGAAPQQRSVWAGPLGAALMGNPGVIAMIEHHAMLYGDLRDPVALLRGETEAGELVAYWPYARPASRQRSDRDAVAPYTALMSASQPMSHSKFFDAYSFSHHRCLLDVGGGDGAFLSAVAARSPKLRCVLFDLPAVADEAQPTFSQRGAGVACCRDRRQFSDRAGCPRAPTSSRWCA